MINLRELEIKAGSEDGARASFEQLIRLLLTTKYKTIKNLRPAPGDWGIDAYLGELTSGTWIWQAKYFPNKVDEGQREQIRKSFETAYNKSKEEGFEIKVWTLCIPCDLSGQETKWWEGWKKRNSASTRIKINSMFKTAIEAILVSPDARGIREVFFGKQSVERIKGREVIPMPDPEEYDNSIFIKKLIVAGIVETFSAKTQFFNAELLKAEIHDKGDELELKELTTIYEKIRAMWEPKFNEALMSGNPDLEIPKIYYDMQRSIQNNDQTLLITPKIMASFVHKQGFMQQLSDLCDIGWTKDYRSIEIEKKDE